MFSMSGHHKPLQEYLRVQPDHIKSVDIVSDCVELLHLLIADIDQNSADVLIQVWICDVFYNIDQ